MRFPDGKTMGAGLKRWRESRRWSIKEVAVRAGVVEKTVKEWEGNLRAEFHKVAAQIFPAYGIDDADMFFDFCYPLDDTGEVIKFTDGPSGNLSVSKDLYGLTIVYPSPTHLRYHRTRIDQIILKPGQASRFEPHPGHEYLLVTEGELDVTLATGQSAPPSSHSLYSGEALAFSSFLWHKVTNTGKTDARIVVGRPTWSGPGGLKLPSTF